MYKQHDSSVLCASSGAPPQQDAHLKTFDYSTIEQVGGVQNMMFSGGAGCYQGLSETTIAQMPLEDLYRRIDRNMNKTNSFFDLRLSHAIK